MDVLHPPSLARVTLHEPAPGKRLALLGALGVLYACSLQAVYTTAGEPRRRALAQIAALDEDKAAKLDVGYSAAELQRQKLEKFTSKFEGMQAPHVADFVGVRVRL